MGGWRERYCFLQNPWHFANRNTFQRQQIFVHGVIFVILCRMWPPLMHCGRRRSTQEILALKCFLCLKALHSQTNGKLIIHINRSDAQIYEGCSNIELTFWSCLQLNLLTWLICVELKHSRWTKSFYCSGSCINAVQCEWQKVFQNDKIIGGREWVIPFWPK